MDKKKKSPVRLKVRKTGQEETYTAPVYEEPVREMPSYDTAVQYQQPKQGGMTTTQYFVVALLIVAAFFIGNLSAKVQYLSKNPTPAAPDTAVAPQAPAAEPTVGDVPEITSRDHVRGNKNANVVLIEYSDYECPFCKNFHPTMLEVMKEYGDKVKWVYRHYPLSFHANAQKQSEAAECAYELGGDDAFWKYTDALYERTTSNGTGFALDKLGPLAAELGLNQSAFQTCLDSDTYKQYVADDMAGGQKAGVQGTPGTIIWNLKTGEKKLIPGALPFTSVKPMIDELL